jgi:hypothetical protein
MVAGLIQLALSSNRDAYLFGNPQINFYTYAYKAHVNFAIVNIKHEPQTSSTLNISTEIEKEYEFIITQDTQIDFLSNLYLNYTFPDIYSNNKYRFKWVEHAGTLLIKKAALYYNGNNEIDSITGEWLIIWLELTTPVKDGYNSMTGNIPEMTNPRTNENIYRIRNNIISESDYPDSDKNNLPSIKKRQVSIPLAFFFTRSTNVAFPLLYITKLQPITLKITIRPIEELYTIYSDIFNMNISSKYYNTLYKDKISINKFLKSNFAPNIYIEGTYISIDNSIRDDILNRNNTYTYIYQKINYIEDYKEAGTDSIAGTTRNIEIIHNELPIKEYIWILRREDSILKFNDYCNFTNSIPKNNEDSIMKSASIKWKEANYDRIEERDAYFFNNIQPYQFHSCIPCQGIYCYSFDVLPEKYIPSGSANTNNLKQHIYIKIGKYNDNLLNTLYKKKYPNLSYETPTSYKLDLYIIQHNIMKIANRTLSFVGFTQ